MQSIYDASEQGKMEYITPLCCALKLNNQILQSSIDPIGDNGEHYEF